MEALDGWGLRFNDATGLPGGDSRFFLARALGLSLWMPPACPVEAHVSELRHPDSFQSVKLHWASQWHLLMPPNLREKKT